MIMYANNGRNGRRIGFFRGGLNLRLPEPPKKIKTQTRHKKTIAQHKPF